MPEQGPLYWMDAVILYQERLEQIYSYLAREYADDRELWNPLIQTKQKHRTAFQGFRNKLTQKSLAFDAGVLHAATLQSAVDYMAFVVKGLAQNKYPYPKLVNLVGDFEQNLIECGLFLAFRNVSNQDSQQLEAMVEEIGALRAKLASKENSLTKPV